MLRNAPGTRPTSYFLIVLVHTARLQHLPKRSLVTVTSFFLFLYEFKRDIAIIFSDSLSSLSAIKEEKSACRPKMLDEVLHLINVIPAKVYFIWIPSHLGIKNNERADHLAQNATKDKISVNIGLETLENNNIVKSYILSINGKICGHIVFMDIKQQVA